MNYVSWTGRMVKYLHIEDTSKIQKEEKVPGSRSEIYPYEGGGLYSQLANACAAQ
jgi:hypothetical protein